MQVSVGKLLSDSGYFLLSVRQSHSLGAGGRTVQTKPILKRVS